MMTAERKCLHASVLVNNRYIAFETALTPFVIYRKRHQIRIRRCWNPEGGSVRRPGKYAIHANTVPPTHWTNNEGFAVNSVRATD